MSMGVSLSIFHLMFFYIFSRALSAPVLGRS